MLEQGGGESELNFTECVWTTIQVLKKAALEAALKYISNIKHDGYVLP